MSARGFTLVEALTALTVLGLVAMAVLPAFVSNIDANQRNEERTAAVLAAQQRLESLRRVDPDTLPTGGAPASETTWIEGRRFEVLTYFCVDSSYCPPASPGSRHLTVEVFFDGERIFDVQTVFTQLQ